MEKASAVEPHALASTRHLGEFGDLGAPAAQFPRDACLDEACLLQQGIVLADEAVILVDLGGTRGEFRRELMRLFDDTGGRIGARTE
jgi:hypothetical protein